MDHMKRNVALLAAGQVVMMTGALLTSTCVAINLAGSSVSHFWVALSLLGVGWNFLFIGATSLLTTGYVPAEQAKVQAGNDFAVFGITTLAVLSAWVLQHHFGWRIVNLGVIPGILLIIGALLWLGKRGGMASPQEMAVGRE